MTQKQDNPLILAIESSCDDTAAAVLHNGKMLANIVAGQKIHEQYGGVVPELASRAHQQNILPVVHQALKNAQKTLSDIDAIAYTQGPGLMGSLLVGSQFAKGLSLALNIPTIGINHLQAHVAALYLAQQKPAFPFLCLLVSGGHTQIIKVKNYLDMEIIGTTIDDAAGEAYDKAAKMLNLPYPGGPLIDKYAQLGNANPFKFPKAKIQNYDYSFSGLKTALLYFLQKNVKENALFIAENLNNICASLQQNIVATLLQKLEKAAIENNIKHIGLAGGVSANSLLRKEFEDLGLKHQWKTHIPAFEYCTDNAAMIAIAGYYQYLEGNFTALNAINYSR